MGGIRPCNPGFRYSQAGILLVLGTQTSQVQESITASLSTDGYSRLSTFSSGRQRGKGRSTMVLDPAPETSAAPSEGSRVPAVGKSSRNQYQRTYQACLHCRKRKVKCVPKDDGGQLTPTCAKCHRERRVCVFTQERRVHRSPQSYTENPEPGRTVRIVHGMINPGLCIIPRFRRVSRPET